MAITNISSVEGLMAIVQADTLAAYMRQAVTPNAVMVEEALNAKQVNFATLASTPRLATASQHTEGASITGYSVPISVTECTLNEYALFSPVSKLALKGGNSVAGKIGAILGGQIANTIDHNVLALVSGGVTTTVTSADGFSMQDLMTGIGTVDALGFAGMRKVAILHPLAYWGTYGLANDIISTDKPGNTTVDQIVKAGWVNQIAGVDIYLSAQVETHTTGTYARNVVMAEECIGLGVHNPLVELESAFTPSTNTLDISATTYHKAIVVHADAGFEVNSKIA